MITEIEMMRPFVRPNAVSFELVVGLTDSKNDVYLYQGIAKV